MSHTYSQNYQHIVFSTKERRKLINKSMQPKLWAYMAGIARNHGFLVLANGGMEDHVHLLIQMPPLLSVAKAVSLIKTNSSSWMNEHGMKFMWQEGYGDFSVSKSIVGTVERYIANQEKHHRKMTFEEEFVGLLKKNMELSLIRDMYLGDMPRFCQSGYTLSSPPETRARRADCIGMGPF